MKTKQELWNEYHTKKTKEEKDEFLASLSDEEHYNMMTLPIGNVARIYLTGFRKARQSKNLDKYIIHIPHSSLKVPEHFKQELTISNDQFNKENQFMCDYLIDKFVPDNFNNIIKFNYSRMYCDVERYIDNSKEQMSKYGMGVIYTKDSNGNKFIKRNKQDKQIIIKEYLNHHNKLDNLVEEKLNKYNKCFIIDLHSFSDEFVYKIFKKENNPDICIGINTNNYDETLLQITINHFKKYGYSVKINYPYSGSIISNKYPIVKSIMIEINKRIYLNNKDDYNKLYKCMMEYYKELKRY